MHSFIVDKDFNPKVFDFGIHRLLLPQDELSSYYLPDVSEMKRINLNKIKTNVMNYGVTLLKIFSGNNLQIQGKEIILPENKIMSEDFNMFLSKCLARNCRKRYSWLQLGSFNFVLDDNIELSNIVGDKTLLDDQKLSQIFDYLNNKFDIIINYYNKINFKEKNEFLSQIEIFVNITLFEMKIINTFFNRDIYKKPFSSQNEISFISINSLSEMKKLDLNMTNPILRDLIIIKINGNKLITDFLPKLQKNIKKVEKLSKIINSFTKESSCSGDISNFIQQIINSVYNQSSMQKYFINLMTVKEKNKELKSMELYIAKYLIELIIFVITIVNDTKKKIFFKKDNFVQKFYQIFGEDKNKVEISTINTKNINQRFLIVSFLPVLFKCKEVLNITLFELLFFDSS
jgi:serine/threonine protein kinase